ncbi:ubiquitin conjugation factor E4 A isoform X2 [Copidosoma floridanum]|uniref:ubiquitin conjugation factor E4 A isoform X2 n=1 Tax=Copidosoma floridanum TaxID=29053 RepID=UPI0006C98635|nr:ubiquitin conjugation factor E4 A isoform X2 [Copidosoma floridanum]
MFNNNNGNPFAGLFSTNSPEKPFSLRKSESIIQQPVGKNEEQNISEDILTEHNFASDYNHNEAELDEMIADVFGIILHRSKTTKFSQQLIFIDEKCLEPAIFERLLLTKPESLLMCNKSFEVQDLDDHVIETKILPYLFESYCRLQRYRLNHGLLESVENVRKIILRNVGTGLEDPEIFKEQELIELFQNREVDCDKLSFFVHEVVEVLCSENEGFDTDVIREAFCPILDIIHKEALESQLLILQPYWFFVLQTFAKSIPLAKLLISHSSVFEGSGQAYANTLLGNLLSISCLPKLDNQSFPVFVKPFQQQNNAMDGNIWSALNILNDSLYKVFRALLKYSREVRHLTLQWIANCLHANESRGKLWNIHNNVDSTSILTVSDGFMLNLGTVLLKLCQPFCENLQPDDTRILKVDPTYSAATVNSEQDGRERGLHMQGMQVKTCLIPTPEGETRPVATTFSFITECFHLTHCVLDLGYRIILDKMLKISQDLARIQRMYRESRHNETTEINEFISQRLEIEMTKYLSYRACLLNPELLTLLANFHAANTYWIIQVNMDIRSLDNNLDCYAPTEFRPVIFPCTKIVPKTLRCIPEFIIENSISFIIFLKRWCPNVFEEHGLKFLNPILTMVAALMKSPSRLYNPHLRARLAEGLEALLPNNEVVDQQSVQSLGTFHRQQLFLTHSHKEIIVPNLLNIFVSIEMTGQSVQFEQKFNYRRPMYIVMEYLWKIPEHRNNFKKLAKEAEVNMEAMKPPLFLRFINLLMNDAVFLLDDALSNMVQLKQLISVRNSDDWKKFSPQERQQQSLQLEHIGMIAKFDNILGRKTMETLKILTTEIKSIFCHQTMVDRIASMLNYLLLQLVGPNKKNLKVKDQDEYEFKPAELVLNICEIYIHLSKNDCFALAVSQDGRSYSSALFNITSDVLVRIGGGSILADLKLFAKRVENAALQKKEEEESLNDAPDEFLDPIMSTLMLDPVILPSSKTVVDRRTIARHLLSDQTDPFNRSPLTMDMVRSDEDLKKRIKEWIDHKKK